MTNSCNRKSNLTQTPWIIKKGLDLLSPIDILKEQKGTALEIIKSGE